MAPTTWTFSSRSGHQLHAVLHKAKAPLKAVLVFNHGVGEHCGRYESMFTKMAEAGIESRCFDMRCFGRSCADKKQRGHIDSFTSVVEDLEDFYKDAAAAHAPAQVPLFIGGQSLGGLIATHAALLNQSLFRGLILSAPALDVEWTPVLRFQAVIGNLLATLIPKARLVPAVQVAHLSQDPAVLEDYVADPLNDPGNLRCRLGNESLSGMRALAPRYGEVTLPLYGVHGDADKITSLPAHRKFVDAVGSKDKTLTVVPGGYHEVLLGPEKEEVIAGIMAWILQHSEGSPSTGMARM